MRRGAKGQRGQAIIEYALLASALAGALFLPVFPTPDGNMTSIFMAMIMSFDIYINSFHTVVTLPIP